MLEWIGNLLVADVALAIICGAVAVPITRDIFDALLGGGEG